MKLFRFKLEWQQRKSVKEVKAELGDKLDMRFKELEKS